MKKSDLEGMTKINEGDLIGKTINIPGATYSNNYHIPIKVDTVTQIENRPMYLINFKYAITMGEYFKLTDGEWLVEIGNSELPFRDYDNRETLFGK